jgi:hypothetical protein
MSRTDLSCQFLQQAATLLYQDQPNLSRLLMSKMIRLAKEEGLELMDKTRKMVCLGCGTLFQAPHFDGKVISKKESERLKRGKRRLYWIEKNAQILTFVQYQCRVCPTDTLIPVTCNKNLPETLIDAGKKEGKLHKKPNKANLQKLLKKSNALKKC